MRARLTALLVASLAGGGLLGCVIELSPHVSCGDNFVDALAGEECEPGVESSWADSCAELNGSPPGPEVCDPVSCTLVKSRCSLCGNGEIDPGEECDGSDLGGVTCATGLATCTDACTLDRTNCWNCGDRKVDPNEECDPLDPSLDPDDPAKAIPCTSLNSPGGTSRKYGSGAATVCLDDCTWDRSGCSYCGNDRLETVSAPVDPEGMIVLEPEVCDGNRVGDETLQKFCKDECGSPVHKVECSFTCLGCSELAPPESPLPLACCTASGEDCPYTQPNDDLKPDRRPCCWALAHPPGSGDDMSPCDTVMNNETNTLVRVCR